MRGLGFRFTSSFIFWKSASCLRNPSPKSTLKPQPPLPYRKSRNFQDHGPVEKNRQIPFREPQAFPDCEAVLQEKDSGQDPNRCGSQKALLRNVGTPHIQAGEAYNVHHQIAWHIVDTHQPCTPVDQNRLLLRDLNLHAQMTEILWHLPRTLVSKDWAIQVPA